MTALAKYDAACRAIASARRVDEAKEIRDQAEAMRVYARQAGNQDMEIDATEIRVRAERRLGELIKAQKEGVGLATGGRPSKTPSTAEVVLPTLADVGVDYKLSSRSQKLAGIGQQAFEVMIDGMRERMRSRGYRVPLDILKAGHINGSRSIMGSRQEPDDSLDYFPTPPWATRALIEKVLRPQLGTEPLHSAWEPACGEGHIAEVLREYFPHVYATDIFDYGYGEHLADFLRPDIGSSADWIITNPPFGDKTEPFVLRAIEQAQIGVAMFVRLQWLESVGRYENVFRDYPPTILAFFAERVNLCKGRWEPAGTTATAYIWLVWIRGTMPRPPMWIPPGQRQAMKRDGDAEIFTAHPIIKRDNPLRLADDGSPTDPVTGEIAAA